MAIRPDDDEWLDVRSIYDVDEDEAWDDGGSLAAERPVRGAPAIPPSSYQAWLRDLDWRHSLPVVAQAERDLESFLTRLKNSDVGPYMREVAVADEAVADASLGGFTTSRARVQGINAEIDIQNTSRGDHLAERTRQQLGRAYSTSSGGEDDPQLSVERFLRRELAAAITETGGAPANLEEDAVAFENWIGGLEALQGENRIVATAAAIWGLVELSGLTQVDAMRLGRLVSPALLAVFDRGVAKSDAPVFLSRGFLHMRSSWRPLSTGTSWVEGFADGLGRACRIHTGTIGLIERRLNLVQELENRHRSHSVIGDVARYFITRDLGTTEDIWRHLHRRTTKKNVRENLERLKREPDGGMIREVTGRSLYQIWARSDVSDSEINVAGALKSQRTHRGRSRTP